MESETKRNRLNFLRSIFQMRLSTLLWVFLFLGLFLIWQKDRANLERRIANLEQGYSGSLNGSYGADQLIGAPDVAGIGDNPNAWCPATMDGKQWIWLDYGKAISAKSIDVYESWSPGTIVKVTATDWWGREKTVWSGTTKPPVAGKTKIRFGKVVKTRRLKVYMDCSKVQGWNEIDSIGMVDETASVFWPKHSKTSSSWGNANTDSAQAKSTSAGGLGLQISGFNVFR